MREDTVTTKVYQFDELSDEAKQTAVERLWDINVDYGWWDFIFEDAARIGLKITEFDLDRNRHCWGKWTEDAEETARLILAEHGDQCETYRDAEAFLTEYNKAEQVHKSQPDYDPDYENFAEFNETDECGELCEEFQRTILEDYSIIIQHEYEFLTSEEAIIEIIEANEYEFTADGNLY